MARPPAPPMAPESIATAFGSNLAATSGTGTIVTIQDSAGTVREARLLYAYPRQAAFIIPAGTTTGSATVTVSSGDGTISTAATTRAN